MKNILKLIMTVIAITLIYSLTSCSSVKEIGKLNMVSNRNVQSTLNYTVISTYAGGATKEVRRSRARTIEQAVDNTVKKVAGGEFLMNVKIYQISGKYFAVEGDVWGPNTKEAPSVRGFKVGDRVTWKPALLNYQNGTIKAFKDDLKCIVERSSDNVILELPYEQLTKLP